MAVRVPDIPGFQPTNINAPQVDPRAAAAPYRALGDVANAIGSVGSAFAEHAERLQNAENQRALSSTRSRLDEMRSGLLTELQTVTDPAEQIRRTDHFLQQAKNLVEDPTHAPAVRDRLLPYFDGWATDTRTTVAEGAARLTQQRARLAAENELSAAVDAGDLSRADSVLSEQVGAGLMLPEEADQVRGQLQQQASFRQATRDIEADPLAVDIEADDFLESYPGLTVEDRDRLRRFAESSRNQAAGDLWNDTLNAAMDGTVLSPEDLRDLAEQDLITASQRASYARTYHSGEPVAADPELYTQVHDAITAYDPGSDPTGIGLANLRAELATVPLPPEHLKELQSRLNDVATPPGRRTGRHRLAADFSTITKERFEAGQFGQWFSMDGSEKDIDLPAYQDAILLKRDFLDAWEPYLQNAPPDLDPTEARQTYDTLFEALVTDRDSFALFSDDLFAPGVDYGAEIDATLGLIDQGPGVLPAKEPKANSFGGQPIQRAGHFYERAGVSVFGGTADPVDNGKSAFGGTTGTGGKEGVAIPKKILEATFPGKGKKWWGENVRVVVRTPQGGTHVFPVADLGTAEWVWEKKGRPVLDLTPGALRRIGGRVLTDSAGNQKGVAGVDNIAFSLTTIDAGMPLQGAEWSDVWKRWFETVKPRSPGEIDTARKALLAAYLQANYSED